MASLNSLSIYIHIPFCIQRCRYCDFYSETGADTSLLEQTLDALIQSLESSLQHLKPERIPTMFIGGGTPSLIPPDMLDVFLSQIEERVIVDDEFTIEVNPESLSVEFLEVLAHHSVNRISMGVQSYDEELLSWLGRPAGRDTVFRADELLSGFWTGRISRDLMAGLPERQGDIEPSERILEDLSHALRSHPGHISIYELTVEEGTPLAGCEDDLKRLPDEDDCVREWSAAVHHLEDLGYQRYEVSNFALPGYESRHNLNYWRMQPYLGIGPGAASTLPGVKEQAVRRQEPRDVSTWLKNPSVSFSEVMLNTGELALEHFMMGLRTREGLSEKIFSLIFGISPADAAPESIERWTESGMLESDSLSLRPTSPGMELLDGILADVAFELDNVRWPDFCRWPQP